MLIQVNIFRDEDGMWCASGVGPGDGLHTQGIDLEDLFANIEEAAQLHFEEDLAAGKTIDVLITAQKEIVGALATLESELDGC